MHVSVIDLVFLETAEASWCVSVSFPWAKYGGTAEITLPPLRNSTGRFFSGTGNHVVVTCKAEVSRISPSPGEKCIAVSCQACFFTSWCWRGSWKLSHPSTLLTINLMAREGRDEGSSTRQHFPLLQWLSWKDPSHRCVLSLTSFTQKKKGDRDPDGLSGGRPNCRQERGQGTLNTHSCGEGRHMRLGRWAPANKW